MNTLSIKNITNLYQDFKNNNIDNNDIINKDIINKDNIFYKNTPSLIPIFPLYKNLFRIFPNRININIFKHEILNYNNTWNNKDNYSNAWKSITLKSKDGLDQDFLEPTYLGINNKNIFKFTNKIDFFPNIKFFLQTFKTDIYLVRLLKLNAGGIIKFHTDEIVFNNTNNIIRCHLPIITHPNVLFKIGEPLQKPAPGYSIWNAKVIYEQFLEPGYLWYTNVNCLHSVENKSNIDRIHLVFDIRPTKELLQQIYN
jgi:hypothetical protein